MNYLHPDFSKEKWFAKPLVEQMANVGAEIGRAVSWQHKDAKTSQEFFLCGVALLDVTIDDKKNQNSALKELCRLKEVLGDYFMGSNEYGSTPENWDSYFYFFNVAATAKYYT